MTRLGLLYVALASCGSWDPSPTTTAQVHRAPAEAADRPAPSRRARISVLEPDGQPYAGKAQWCFTTDMPDCTLYKNCNEAVLEDGEIWVDLADNCPLDVVEGRLSVIPNLCFGTFISDRDGGTGDRFTVGVGEPHEPITLEALAVECEGGR